MFHQNLVPEISGGFIGIKFLQAPSLAVHLGVEKIDLRAGTLG